MSPDRRGYQVSHLCRLEIEDGILLKAVVTIALASPSFGQDEDSFTAIRSVLRFLSSKCDIGEVAGKSSFLELFTPKGCGEWELWELKRLAQAVIHFEPILPSPYRSLKKNWRGNPQLNSQPRQQAIDIIDNIVTFQDLSFWMPVYHPTNYRYCWSFEGPHGSDSGGNVLFSNIPHPADMMAIARRIALAVAFVRATRRCASRQEIESFPVTGEGFAEFLGLLGHRS